MDCWMNPVIERSDLLVFNDVFAPLKSRKIGTGTVVPSPRKRSVGGLMRRLSSSGNLSQHVEPQPATHNRGGAVRSRSTSSTQRASGSQTVARMPPKVPGGLIGRDSTVTRLALLLQSKSERRVKLVGPEGSGKTSVGVQVVHQYRNEFPGGVVWLNGSTIVWDVYHFLVDELNLQSYATTFETEHLRQRLWKYLNDNDKRWLLVIDDCEDSLDWVPPDSAMSKGSCLIMSRTKSGSDRGVRVDLPLLSNKSLADLVLRSAGIASCKPAVLAAWTDSRHLLRNLTGIRVLGLISRSFHVALEDLLQRYDALIAQAVLPDLETMLRRAQVGHLIEPLRDAGVLDAMDFVRGRPWTALGDSLTRNDLFVFEKVQESLQRSGNRLATKVLCKMWCEMIKHGDESVESLETAPSLFDPVGPSRAMWDLLQACSFFHPRNIPVDLVATELKAKEQDTSQYDPDDFSDLIHYSTEGGVTSTIATVCALPSLMLAMRSLVSRPKAVNKSLAESVIQRVHSICVDRVFHPDNRFSGLAEGDDSEFRATTTCFLPHISLAVELCSDLLLRHGDAEADSSKPATCDTGRGGGQPAQDNRQDALDTANEPGSVRSRTVTTRPPQRDGFFFSRMRKSSKIVHRESTESHGSADGEQKPALDQTAGQDSSPTCSVPYVARSYSDGELPCKDSKRRHSLVSVTSESSFVPEPSASRQNLRDSPKKVLARRHTNSLGTFSEAGTASPPTGIIKSLARRLSFGKSSQNLSPSPSVFVADLLVLEGMLLLLIPLGNGRLSRAEARFRAALSIYKSKVNRSEESRLILSTSYLIGQTLFKRGLVVSAAEIWSELLEEIEACKVANIVGKRSFLLVSIGVIHAAVGRFKDAVPLLEAAKALTKDSSDRTMLMLTARTHVALAITCKAQGDSAAASQQMKDALAIFDNLCPLSMVTAEVHEFLAAAYLKLRQPKDSMAHIEEAISIYSAASAAMHTRNVQLSEAYCLLGDILVELGEFRKAREEYMLCLEHSDRLFGRVVDNPDAVNVLQNVAKLSAALGNVEEADRFAKGAEDMQSRLADWGKVFATATARECLQK